jgi:hypothetical protein
MVVNAGPGASTASGLAALRFAVDPARASPPPDPLGPSGPDCSRPLRFPVDPAPEPDAEDEPEDAPAEEEVLDEVRDDEPDAPVDEVDDDELDDDELDATRRAAAATAAELGGGPSSGTAGRGMTGRGKMMKLPGRGSGSGQKGLRVAEPPARSPGG